MTATTPSFRTPRIKDVARHAGVSQGTVSNVLNRPWVVSPGTRDRVLDSIRALGFVRHEAARHLRAGQSRTVGLLVPGPGDPFFREVAHAAESVAWEHDTMVTLCDTRGDPARELRHLNQLEQRRVMGGIVAPVPGAPAPPRTVPPGGAPLVVVNGPPSDAHCSVTVNERLCGVLAGRHLLRRGHRRIAFLGARPVPSYRDERIAGLAVAIARSPGSSLETLEAAGSSIGSGRALGERLAARPQGERPTAAWCANDMIALGLLYALLGRGVRVPGDVAIIGHGDTELAVSAPVPLSSLRLPGALVGDAAMRLLLAEAEDGPTHRRHQQLFLEPRLVVRASSG